MAFNAVAGLNPFTIIAVMPQLLVHWYFTGKFNILTGTETLTRVWGAAVGWFSGVFGAIGQVVSGFVSGRSASLVVFG